jgi:hypothetical protein
VYKNPLNETPDVLTLPNKKTTIDWMEGDTYPFGYYKNKFILGDKYGTHDRINPIFKSRESFKYPGRVWKKYKIISFWTYPDEKMFKQFIEDLSNALNIDIMSDPKWKVEVLKKKKSNEIKKTKNFGAYNSRGTWKYRFNDEYKVDYVSIQEYAGSEARSEEELKIRHLMTPGAGKKPVPPGFGSKSPEYMKKRQWQMATVGDESKKEEGPKLNEEVVDEQTPEEHIKQDINHPDLNKKLIGTFKDVGEKEVKIFTVNGDYVRDKEPGLNFPQFVEGGSYYVTSYPKYKKYIPEDEIWLDDVHETKPNDLKAILYHEFVERNLMKYKKWNYSDAHEYANKKETEYRARVKN